MATTNAVTTPAAGDIITTPRSLFIDFRNIRGRKINDTQISALTKSFVAVSRAVGANAAATCDTLVAEPVPGDKRSEQLAVGGAYNADAAKLRVMRLAFSESATGKTAPLSASLVLDLRDRTAKSAVLTVHAPEGDSAKSAHDLYDQLETLLNKGLLNEIKMRFSTRDGSLSMSCSRQAFSAFTLCF